MRKSMYLKFYIKDGFGKKGNKHLLFLTQKK